MLWEYVVVIGDRGKRLNFVLYFKFFKSILMWYYVFNLIDLEFRDIFLLDSVFRDCNWGFYRKKFFLVLMWKEGKEEGRKEYFMNIFLIVIVIVILRVVLFYI